MRYRLPTTPEEQEGVGPSLPIVGDGVVAETGATEFSPGSGDVAGSGFVTGAEKDFGVGEFGGHMAHFEKDTAAFLGGFGAFAGGIPGGAGNAPGDVATVMVVDPTVEGGAGLLNITRAFRDSRGGKGSA